MKKIFLSCFTLLSISLPALANRESGGGNDVGLDFLTHAKSALQQIKQKPELTSKISIPRLEDLMTQAHIVVVDQPLFVTVDGVVQSSVAINSPDTNVIQINSDRWKEIYSNTLKEGLAIHEFLGLEGLEPSGVYIFSSEYLRSLGESSASLFVTGHDQGQQHRAICSDAQTKTLISVVLNPGERPLMSIKRLELSGQLSVIGNYSTNVTATFGSRLLEVSAIDNQDFIQVQSSFQDYGGTTYEPGEEMWNGKATFSNSLAEKIGKSKIDLACYQDL